MYCSRLAVRPAGGESQARPHTWTWHTCLAADAFFKAAISLVPEVPKMINIDGKMRPAESFLLEFLCNFFSTLLIVPVCSLLRASRGVCFCPPLGGLLALKCGACVCVGFLARCSGDSVHALPSSSPGRLV